MIYTKADGSAIESDGYLTAVEKGQDETRELSRLLREFLPVTETTSDLQMVKMLISMYQHLKDKLMESEQLAQARLETLRDRLAQAALSGLLAAGQEIDCRMAYRFADTALGERDPEKSEDE